MKYSPKPPHSSSISFKSWFKQEKTNRWANIVLGIIFIGFNLFHFAEHVMVLTAHQLIIVGTTVIAALLIVWYAWKWPKKEK